MIPFLSLETKGECSHLRNSAPVVPRTWYHICIGIDTDSGLLRIVDNGVQAFNGKNDYLENTASMKPKSLAGKLLGNGTFWLPIVLI